MNTINDRIEVLINALGFRSVRKFDAAINKALGTTWKITGSLKQKPGSDYLEALLKKYPETNAFWLLTGEGEIFAPEKLRREYVEKIEKELEIATREKRRYEMALDMAASRMPNFQRHSKRTPVGKIVSFFAKNLAKSA